MKISRTLAIALVGLSIGLSATSANAGLFRDVVGKVGSKVKQNAGSNQSGKATPYSWMGNKGFMDCLKIYKIYGTDAEKQNSANICAKKHG